MVRFGKKLANNRVTHWESEYVDYARLKALVRPRLSAPTLEAGADAFERAVLGEIRKVEAFYIAKVGEFARQLELFAAHRRAHARTLRAAVRPSNRHGNANEMAVANAMSVNGERARDADDERDVLILRTAEADGSGEGEASQSPSQSDESDELRAAARSVARMSSSAIAALLDTDDAAASGSGSESDSGVPMALGSATHLPTVHADDAPSARAVRQLRGAPHVQRTKAKRRHAWVELAREIYLLRNFTKLNYTAVVKICKKYNKVTGAALDARKLLGPFAFVEADELERIRDTVHRRFAAEFCNGDLHLASQLLLEKQGVDVDWCAPLARAALAPLTPLDRQEPISQRHVGRRVHRVWRVAHVGRGGRRGAAPQRPGRHALAAAALSRFSRHWLLPAAAVGVGRAQVRVAAQPRQFYLPARL